MRGRDQAQSGKQVVAKPGRVYKTSEEEKVKAEILVGL
jgi:hypothetical protein